MTDRERLLAVIERENMTGKQFAEAVGIGAGTISNISNGRNNPSLDLLQRVHSRFPKYSASWLYEGKGEMEVEYVPTGAEIEAAQAKPVAQTSLLDGMSIVPQPLDTAEEKKQELPAEAAPVVEKVVEKVIAKKIERIVIFYTDGTFEER